MESDARPMTHCVWDDLPWGSTPSPGRFTHQLHIEHTEAIPGVPTTQAVYELHEWIIGRVTATVNSYGLDLHDGHLTILTTPGPRGSSVKVTWTERPNRRDRVNIDTTTFSAYPVSSVRYPHRRGSPTSE